MSENLAMLGEALLGFMTPTALFHVAWATLLGVIVGARPGLTATLGVALMTTLTFKMAAEDAILILICMYVGAIYGGSRSAILLNIPARPPMPPMTFRTMSRWRRPPNAGCSTCCSSPTRRA